MGLYNVVGPCYVAGWQHVRPTTEPIEIDDTEAAPLVEAGSLEPYRPGLDALAPGAGAAAKLGLELANRTIQYVGEKTAEAVEGLKESFDNEPPTIPPPPRKPRGRRSEG